MAHVVRVRRSSVQRHHMCDEDDDPPSSCEHDMQRAIHYLWIFFRNLSDPHIEPYPSAFEHRWTSADEKADSGRRGRGFVWRNVDRLAKTVYVAQELPQGRYRIP